MISGQLRTLITLTDMFHCGYIRAPLKIIPFKLHNTIFSINFKSSTGDIKLIIERKFTTHTSSERLLLKETRKFEFNKCSLFNCNFFLKFTNQASTESGLFKEIRQLPNRDLLLKNFFTLPGIAAKKKEYVGKKVVGFTMEQMFDVVSDVENYKKFVPFCIKSNVTQKTPHLLSGDLEVGFPPIVESYTSHVTLQRPHSVRAVCTDGKLFDHLTTTWRFDPGIKNKPHTCTIHFYLSFEFKSMLHSQLANVFFDKLVKQMEWAFVKEAEKRYGPPTITTIKM